ncbi:hypothetical protein [Photobacterium phosphoreum]|jgi:hypothetical protein|uniref:hypothetical protein n=1 Tax=Photobacterium phosphoreum TaxID=659 RepID=UPI0005D3B486|nr:hypothetical protein [Photobacterium phosphoreum]KJF88244.1 hypothetical protein UB41_02575 [Photobacterium phosphoreum]MCD9463211.1 hypothetical protein [Photobacterium phosphoreum]MCD9479337.1 hypothetical protein [Photobacterium phosphoreum]MCD9484461.1 hypothetical protein [Photobacterium phosphoreum]MCD9501766.1 hypothetical protein [Photobacterium phosphoreum]
MKKSTKSALAVLAGIVVCSLAFTIIKSEQTSNSNTVIEQTQNKAVELPASALPKQVNTDSAPTGQIKDTPYKCSDFDPKTGGLKGWTADMGIGPAIPEQLLPKDCPALQH